MGIDHSLDTESSAAFLEDFANRLRRAAIEQWHGVMDPGEEIEAQLDSIARRLRAGAASAPLFATTDVQFLEARQNSLNRMHGWVLKAPDITPEGKAKAEAGLQAAQRFGEIAGYLRDVLAGRPIGTRT